MYGMFLGIPCDERKSNQSCVGINWKPEATIGTLNVSPY